MKKVIRFAAFLAMPMALLSMNSEAWVITIFAFHVVMYNFLQAGKFPIVLLSLLIPFIEIATSLIHAEARQLTISDLYGPGGGEAYVLAIITFILFTMGLNLGLRRQRGLEITEEIEGLLRDFSMKKLILGHVFLMVFSGVANAIVVYGTSFFQLVVHVRKFSLILLYIIVWKADLEKKNRTLIALIVGVNLVLRLSGFFSEWKDVIVLLVFVSFLSVKRLDTRWFRRLTIAAIFGFGLLFTWQAIKADYRSFLNGGTRSQKVVVGIQDALLKFGELTKDTWLKPKNDNENELVWMETLDRIGYIDFFAKTLERVPSEIPHQRGDLLTSNLRFALAPRILFPDKGIKNDQLKVEKFAGVEIANNASFSLGRYVEWYVDFGYGMLLVGALFGWIGAQIIRFVQYKRHSPFLEIINPIFLFLVMQTFCSFQSDEIVITGQTFWALLVYLTFGRSIMAALLKFSLPSGSGAQ